MHVRMVPCGASAHAHGSDAKPGTAPLAARRPLAPRTRCAPAAWRRRHTVAPRDAATASVPPRLRCIGTPGASYGAAARAGGGGVCEMARTGPDAVDVRVVRVLAMSKEQFANSVQPVP